MPHRKFSQEELELAYKQMEIERKKDELTAKKAVGFLKIKLNGVREKVVNVGMLPMIKYYIISPFPHEYALWLTYSTYGAQLNDYVKALESLPEVKKLETLVGYDIKLPKYEIETPFGKYKVLFQYFDHGNW